ncbi:hypothetical protein TNCV_2513361 [Trichonephila clavipes]|nr:hypothetical protein TNCV_2513361 [Trichonephila clavipes]
MRLQVRKGTVDGYEWRCRSQSKDNRLDVVRSVRKGTWFSESKLAKTIILRLTRYWFGKSMNAFVVNDLKVNKKDGSLVVPGLNPMIEQSHCKPRVCDHEQPQHPYKLEINQLPYKNHIEPIINYHNRKER